MTTEKINIGVTKLTVPLNETHATIVEYTQQTKPVFDNKENVVVYYAPLDSHASDHGMIDSLRFSSSDVEFADMQYSMSIVRNGIVENTSTRPRFQLVLIDRPDAPIFTGEIVNEDGKNITLFDGQQQVRFKWPSSAYKLVSVVAADDVASLHTREPALIVKFHDSHSDGLAALYQKGATLRYRLQNSLVASLSYRFHAKRQETGHAKSPSIYDIARYYMTLERVYTIDNLGHANFHVVDELRIVDNTIQNDVVERRSFGAPKHAFYTARESMSVMPTAASSSATEREIVVPYSEQEESPSSSYGAGVESATKPIDEHFVFSSDQIVGGSRSTLCVAPKSAITLKKAGRLGFHGFIVYEISHLSTELRYDHDINIVAWIESSNLMQGVPKSGRVDVFVEPPEISVGASTEIPIESAFESSLVWVRDNDTGSRTAWIKKPILSANEVSKFIRVITESKSLTEMSTTVDYRIENKLRFPMLICIPRSDAPKQTIVPMDLQTLDEQQLKQQKLPWTSFVPYTHDIFIVSGKATMKFQSIFQK